MIRALGLSTILLAFAACGDDNKQQQTDAGVTPDMMEEVVVDAAPDAMPFVAPTPFSIGISATGQDQAMSAAPGPSGSFYLAGYTSTSVSTAPTKYLFVAKLTSAGVLDTTFATGGIYTSTIVFTPAGSSGTDEIDIAVQSTGHIVVAATVANDIDGTDRDIGLFRLDATGALDTTGFGTAGTGGFSRLNLSTKNTTGAAALDSQRGLAIGPSDAIYIHATARDMVDTASGGGERIDTDFAVAKLSAAGVLDAGGYGTGGKFLLDLGGTNAEANATAKGIQVLSTGVVIAGGYANAPGIGSTQPVLFRLTAAGALDSSAWSGNGGVFYDTVLAKQTEIYNFAIDGDRITTAGYGRATDISTNCCNDWVALRFNTSTGERDTSFGGGPNNGAVQVDPTGTHAGSNCRNAIALPNGGTALIGSAGPGGTRDAALAILKQNGHLDTDYGTGVMTFSLDGSEDQWWGGAVSGGKLLLVGWKGVGATQTDSANDNSYGVLLDL